MDSDWHTCVEFYKARVACMDAILGAHYPNLETADACDSLGDALQKKTSSPKDAEVAYQRALQMFQIVDGSNGSSFKATVNKLLSVQERLVNGAVDRGTVHCAECRHRNSALAVTVKLSTAAKSTRLCTGKRFIKSNANARLARCVRWSQSYHGSNYGKIKQLDVSNTL